MHAIENRYPEWIDSDYGKLPIRINGNEVFAEHNVLVYYAENRDVPKLARIEPSRIELRDPWWPEPDKLWNLVTETNVKSNW